MASLEENPLEYWLAKSTNPLNKEEDKESIQSFCEAVNNENDGPNTALRLICHKIQSPQEREALQGLTVLENCVKCCDYRFHLEIGKFRFLNEMVKVVSPKYLGLQTSEKVKKKVVELLYEWMITLKNEPKIAEAYAMLKKQGVVLEDPVYVEQNIPQPELPSTPTPRSKNAVFEDQEKSQLLHKLLQSKNPEDLQAANRLIKTMVKEDERRTERISKRVTELETAASNTKLLSEILDNLTTPSSEELELMKELYQSCEKLRPALFRLASETDEGDDGIADILKANDEVTAVMNRYKELVGDNEQISNSSLGSTCAAKDEKSLLELTSPDAKPSSLLDNQLFSLDISDQQQKSKNGNAESSVMEQLGDIFTKPSAKPHILNSHPLSPFSATNALSHVEPLKPLSNDNDTSLLMADPSPPLSFTKGGMSLIDGLPACSQATTSERKNSAFKELDNLVKSSLPTTNNVPLAFPTQASKTPMNQLPKKSDEKFILQKEEARASSPEKIVPKSLDGIKIDVQNIKPASVDPLTLLDKDGVSVVIYFTLDKPCQDVNVMVATTLNRSTSPLSDFHFNATVTSTEMNIKIVDPSSTTLPAFNPILPPASISTVMLVSNPSKLEINFNFEISYSRGNTKVSEDGTATCPMLS